MKRFVFFVCVLLYSFAMAEESDVTVVVKSQEELENIKNELEQLQTQFVKGDHDGFDALMKQASDIYEMNDRCSTISLTEMIDQSCVTFYQVNLPAFEEKYMEVTGELRLNSVKMARDLEARKNQLAACSEALFSILVPYEQLFKVNGKVKLEPVDDRLNFEADYDYTMSYDTKRMQLQRDLAQKWIDKCGEIVMRDDGVEFAPYFINKIKDFNSSLNAEGTNMRVQLDEDGLLLSVEMANPARGVYYLNGATLFETTLERTDKPHLRLNMREEVAMLPLGASAVIEHFKGRKQFYSAYAGDLAGRWKWAKVNDIREQNNTPAPETLYKDNSDQSGQNDDEETASASEVSYENESDQENQNDDEDDGDSDSNEVDYSGNDWNMEGDFASSIGSPISSGMEDDKPAEHWSTTRKAVFISSSAATFGGLLFAIIGNSMAKSASERETSNMDKFNKTYDAIGSYQSFRNFGIGLAIVGAIGVGISFAF